MYLDFFNFKKYPYSHYPEGFLCYGNIPLCYYDRETSANAADKKLVKKLINFKKIKNDIMYEHGDRNLVYYVLL